LKYLSQKFILISKENYKEVKMEISNILGYICLGAGAWLLFGNANILSIRVIGLLTAGLGLAFISNRLKFK